MHVSRQPEVNVGLVGHVDHGKTSLVKALTGTSTDRHSEEIKRGISIKLGYADAHIFRCDGCDKPECYSTQEEFLKCDGPVKYMRSVSFVDSPGHETLMATMLSGAAIMDGALLIIAANEKCPQPQTKEHLMALNVIGVRNLIIVQNKIDIVTEEQAIRSYEEITRFVRGTFAENAPIVPVSAHHRTNLDYLTWSIEKVIPTPERDTSKPVRMYIARSFDVNVPGTPLDELRGGVIGGTISQGKLSIGDEIEISPGKRSESGNKVTWQPLYSTVVSIQSGGQAFKSAGPGGLIAVGTKLDPSLTKSDSLVGKIAGKPGTLPTVMQSFSMETHLLERVVGSTDEQKIESIKTNEPLMLNLGTSTTVGLVTSARNELCDVNLKIPVCVEKNQRVAISRKFAGKWRLIGFGIVV
ncbi:MAG: translation initiation factor IF-2 subunit gamma [Thermoplasmata archaeon]|uniref:Translation initiation factor 2 subunit gamma n=1 Tax=Candidatus Sysuiplasma superficiale TaxID=2823368 RepID=A0A8J7YMV2_9ARCH|nr:translation initiation factor IF-2 subunit gamma [Candidatus Sysuiplasma superficiale]MBX8643305.1 translation initiation factor IF-2 subunit gamma [Candidatus Sysuiplasma superficiale]MCL4346385.1 translation initiation factor IF-2 subunit gamma [Candidatus Thermoplasmatota archaeon]MCL5437161.1 translation initiation factor IF-2 subunit gamma [Candidatus Thermoplasmatota archaeon]